MKKKLKIAIYSGEIPSTTFIERLIEGISETHKVQIMLFGIIKSYVNYNNAVSIIGCKSGKLRKGLYLLSYSFLLFCFKNKEKKKLDTILKATYKNSLNDKVKSYPVLWHKPDIFHLQWAKGISDWMWVQQFGIKLIVSLRGAHINYSPIADAKLAKVYRQLFPKVNGFHAVSDAIATEAEKYGVSKEKTTVVYSGLDLKKFISIKNQHITKNTVFTMISVGRPHWKKGYTYMLDTCKLLQEAGISFQYIVVGGLSSLELIYQVESLKLNDTVRLMDNIPFSEVQELIQSSDLMVLPSVEEGVANVVLEAMALNTLILTSDCGGMDEVIRNNENGFIVPVRDTKVLAKTIISIIKLPESERSRLIENAYKTLENQHIKQNMITDMLELYKKIGTN